MQLREELLLLRGSDPEGLALKPSTSVCWMIPTGVLKACPFCVCRERPLGPLPLSSTRPGVNRSVVSFAGAIMSSLLPNTRGYLSGDSCCFVTSFPVPRKAEKLAIQGMGPRLWHGNEVGEQAKACTLWTSFLEPALGYSFHLKYTLLILTKSFQF